MNTGSHINIHCNISSASNQANTGFDARLINLHYPKAFLSCDVFYSKFIVFDRFQTIKGFIKKGRRL